jgi:hypothetical protein
LGLGLGLGLGLLAAALPAALVEAADLCLAGLAFCFSGGRSAASALASPRLALALRTIAMAFRSAIVWVICATAGQDRHCQGAMPVAVLIPHSVDG